MEYHYFIGSRDFSLATYMRLSILGPNYGLFWAREGDPSSEISEIKNKGRIIINTKRFNKVTIIIYRDSYKTVLRNITKR